MPKPTRQFAYTLQDLVTCPAPPGLFLVLVTVAPDDGETDSTVFPVVALRSSTRYHYSAPIDPELARSPSYERMLTTGWTFDLQEIVTEPLVIDPDGTDLVEPSYLTYDYGIWAATKMVHGELDREELGVLVVDASAAIQRHVEFHRENALEV